MTDVKDLDDDNPWPPLTSGCTEGCSEPGCEYDVGVDVELGVLIAGS